MRYEREREHGVVTVQVLDISPLIEHVEAELADVLDGDHLESSMTYALGHVGDRVYLLCSEGVGGLVAPDAADSEFGIDLYVHSTSDDGSQMFSMFPLVTVRVDVEGSTYLPVTATVDLADFIRTFGARLEANFATWRSILTDEQLPDALRDPSTKATAS